MSKAIDYNIVGKNLARLLKENSLTQSQLARRMGVYSDVIHRYVKCKHVPNCNTLQELAVALDVNIIEFFKPIEEG